MRILLVEDDVHLASSLTEILTTHRYAVDTVKNGEAGWEHVKVQDYDLILLDITLPKLDVKKGYFKGAGLEVEAVKFASPNQVAEGLIAGRLQGTGNGVASGALGLAEITSPGLFKIFASNPSNSKNVLDQIIVAKDSSIRSIADLQGKKFATGPGAQNIAIAKGILEKSGIRNPQVTQLEIRQHIAAIESAQIDAAYTLESTGTVGEIKGITKVLENGVAKYILGSPLAPWFGGFAALSTKFIQSKTAVYLNKMQF